MIITKTPYRISFFGGGSDYPSWYKKNGGSVLSTTIDKYLYISCRFSPNYFKHKYRIVWRKIENVQKIEEINHKAVRELLKYLKIKLGLEIHYYGDLPARSGMGSSSSFTVGLMKALYRIKEIKLNKKDLANKSIYFEQEVMKEVVGSQLTTVKRNHINKIMSYVTEGERILNSDNIDDFGRLLHEAWMEKKELSRLITNSKIDEIYDQAMKYGALGGKLLGAGGGGFLLMYMKKSQRENYFKRNSRVINVPFQFTRSGSEIIFDHLKGKI